MKKRRRLGRLTLLALAAVSTVMLTSYPSNAQNERTWSVYKADEKSSTYSPLTNLLSITLVG